METIPFNANSIGNNTIIAAVADKYLDIWLFMMQASLGCAITLKSGSNPLTGQMTFVAGGSFHTPYIGQKLMRCGINEAFIINIAGLVGGCSGIIMYEETT